MILKPADDKFPSIAKLEVLLKTGRVPPDKRGLVEKELNILKAGIKGEEESAYQIDFYLRDSKNTMVIHDLRLELPDGRVAQIDHLLIHRTFRFYILETKHFSHGIKINETGEFLRWNDWKKAYEGMPSPIEQNQRHALVLGKVLEEMGLSSPTIRSFILVAPNARIDRPKSEAFDTSMVVKADQFLSALEKDLAGAGTISLFGGLAKTLWQGSHEDVAKKLIARHRPININYVAKFGLANLAASSAAAPAPGPAAAQAPAPTPQPVAASKPYPAEPTAANVQVAKEPEPGFQCRQCGSNDMAILWGKYGYYFKCRKCQGNTPIKLDCGHPGHKEKLRKEGDRFFRECGECKSSSLFYTNPAGGT